MTSGTNRLGWETGASTTYACDIVTKTWAGTDHPKRAWERVKVDNSYDRIVYKVREGKRITELEHVLRFRTVKIRPPKRARNDEHPYTATISRTLHRIVDYRRPLLIGYDQWYTQSSSTFGLGYIGASPAGWSSNDDIALIGKLRERVAGSDFNAGVFLGEGREALKMISESAFKLYRGFRAVKQGRLIDAARYFTHGTSRHHLSKRRIVANHWLELQYGWLPLMKDMQNAAEFLAQQLNFPLQHTVRVRRSISGPAAGSVQTWLYSAPVSQQVECSGQIKAILREKDVAQLSGLLDPISVAWELVPFSFVIDWALPIGQYLSARGLASALTGTFVTTRVDRWRARGLVGTGRSLGPSYYYEFQNAGQIGLDKVVVNRSVSSTLQVPLPSIKPLEKVASWKHCANSVALLTGLSDSFARKHST